ncbi:Gfo/Idh/MocA family protein [Roseimaritima ulvae]|uniref:Inositol 2-dehydrogenase n=1 Tax=Roseimaritima ulvae TaxID=980254 RepID=A0A5B9R5L9_9BACT|nr:Gfo/Idh/MocA family oxidoreductase [Roseimaritima ulvae]QEG41821.1 Inositol 2-dehydrogenase [Roseimaritima ulvae]
MVIGAATEISAKVSELAELAYRPPSPQYRPPIGLIGCGGIAKHHLEAYRDFGLNVVAVCDLQAELATELRDRFFPDAQVFTDHHRLLADESIEVVDVATHPEPRVGLIQDCLAARRHVLSQKPFVLDLDVGQQLCDMADRQGVRLAVNQNGRFAPHFSYLRAAVAAGCLGRTQAAHLSVHWDHTWVTGTAFEQIKHLILYDFAIHWFDIVRCLLPLAQAESVYATISRVPGQQIMPPLAASVVIQFDSAQATLSFDALTRFGQQDRTLVIGDRATATSSGPDLQQQSVTITDAAGSYSPHLEGKWFSDGFGGTMLELLSAIEADRPAVIEARDNLESLALCFAAIESAETGLPQVPGSTRRLPS